MDLSSQGCWSSRCYERDPGAVCADDGGEPELGYARIQGALKHLGHIVARSTIAKVLKEHGIKPSPERPMSWATFVRAHATAIAAADLFTTEVWTARGLVRYFTLFVIDIAARRVHIAETTTNPTSEWMGQMARNLTDCDTGFLLGKRYLIVDRDSIFSPVSRRFCEAPVSGSCSPRTRRRT